MRRAFSWSFAIGLTIAGLVSAATTQPQSLAQRVADVRDGKARMSFAARPGVRCDGSSSGRRDSADWESSCGDGPVRVVIELSRGEVVDLDVYVGGRWRPASRSTVDLGTVSAPRAAEFLLALARQSPARVGRQAIFAAVLADGAVVWPDLLQIVRAGLDPNHPGVSRPGDSQEGGLLTGPNRRRTRAAAVRGAIGRKLIPTLVPARSLVQVTAR